MSFARFLAPMVGVIALAAVVSPASATPATAAPATPATPTPTPAPTGHVTTCEQVTGAFKSEQHARIQKAGQRCIGEINKL